MSGARRSPVSLRLQAWLQRALLMQWPEPKRGSRGNCGAVAPRRRPERAARGSETTVAAAAAFRLLDSQQRTMELSEDASLIDMESTMPDLFTERGNLG